jgi:hypothetical protein
LDTQGEGIKIEKIYEKVGVTTSDRPQYTCIVAIYAYHAMAHILNYNQDHWTTPHGLVADTLSARHKVLFDKNEIKILLTYTIGDNYF